MVLPSLSAKNVGNSRAELVAEMQLATKTGGLATSLPVFAGFETQSCHVFPGQKYDNFASDFYSFWRFFYNPLNA